MSYPYNDDTTNDLQQLVHNTEQTMVAMGDITSLLSTKIEYEAYKALDDEDANIYKSLETRKLEYINRVLEFACDVQIQFEYLKDEIKSELTFQQLFENVQDDQLIDAATILINYATILQRDYSQFAEKIKKYKSRNRRIAQIFAQATFTSGLLVTLTLVALHLTPGVNVAFATTELVIIGIAGVISAAGAITSFFAKDKITRTISYLNNIETNLGKLRGSLTDVKSSRKYIREDNITRCHKHIQKIIDCCEKLKSICENMK